MDSSERHLVRRCLAGERDAFDPLYDRHAARVFNLLRRLTASEAEAEDLTQETFIAAYRSLASWRGHGAFGTWLCGIAWHQYTNARRRQSRAEVEELDEETHPALSEVDPVAACLRHEIGERIEAAIAVLPPLAREAFVLVKVEGLSYREAAAWLGVPLGTIQSRLWRATGLLQAALADLAVPEDPSSAPVRSVSP